MLARNRETDAEKYDLCPSSKRASFVGRNQRLGVIGLPPMQAILSRKMSF